jgi:4-aminobutyrate aminotransferase-like enzyme
MRKRRGGLVAGVSEDGIDVVATEGAWLRDARGRRYVDFVSGWCVGNLGWGNEEVRAAVAEFDGPDYAPPSHRWRGWDEYARRLLDVAPSGLARCFRATGGTEAVETALQAAMAATGRRGLVSVEGAYHGNSVAARSIGFAGGREWLPAALRDCKTIEPPLDRAAARRLERVLRGRRTAAFVMEPVVCNVGCLVPDEEFVEAARDLCRRHGALFVADEVATGFGRTGRLFACERFDLEPDVLCLAKGITGGYAPMGATLATERVARALERAGSPYSTFGWHPRSVAAALATLRVFVRDRREIERRVERASSRIVDRLRRMPFAHRGVLQGVGLALAVRFERAGYPEKVEERARANGLVVSADEETLSFFPPLTIDDATLEEGLDRLERSV